MLRQGTLLLLPGLVFLVSTGSNSYSQTPQQPSDETADTVIAEYKNQITNADPFDRMRSTSHHKIYLLKMKKGKGYKIELQSSDFSPIVSIEDSEGKRLMDGASSGAQGSRVHFTPTETGTFRIIASTNGAGQTGFFKLTVYPALPRKIVLAKQDTLTDKDEFDQVRKSSRCKVYLVKMEQGKEYEINMSSAFDTYLRLEDNNKTQLAQDDDGGSGLNSRLVFRAPRTGMYRVIATTFGQNQTGKFLLNIVGE